MSKANPAPGNEPAGDMRQRRDRRGEPWGPPSGALRDERGMDHGPSDVMVIRSASDHRAVIGGTLPHVSWSWLVLHASLGQLPRR